MNCCDCRLLQSGLQSRFCQTSTRESPLGADSKKTQKYIFGNMKCHYNVFICAHCQYIKNCRYHWQSSVPHRDMSKFAVSSWSPSHARSKADIPRCEIPRSSATNLQYEASNAGWYSDSSALQSTNHQHWQLSEKLRHASARITYRRTAYI